jgi:hypothetical protein
VAVAARLRVVWPALVTLCVTAAYVGWRLAGAGWDPAGLAGRGTRYQVPDPTGMDGYDGQFAYYVAQDPDPGRVAAHLDVPAYRYQRILYPLLSRALSLGQAKAIGWALLATNLLAHFAGTWVVAKILSEEGIWPGYALSYGLWVGLLAGVALDLAEPLAFALVAWAWWARRRQRSVLSAGLLGLALFAKEISLLFWGAALGADLLNRGRRRSAAALGIAGLVFAGWQVWLWRIFGQPGLGSGGAGATPFEWIPFMGLWRIGFISARVLGLYLVAFGPSVLAPAIWGVIAGGIEVIHRRWDAEALALVFTGAAIAFLPFSTFREPLGLVRIASGLVFAVVLFAGTRGLRRPLRYSLFWIPFLAMLIGRG